jgi:hypothetical protein
VEHGVVLSLDSGSAIFKDLEEVVAERRVFRNLLRLYFVQP